MDHYDIDVIGSDTSEATADTIGALVILGLDDSDVDDATAVVFGGVYLVDSSSNFASKHPIGVERYIDLVCLAWGAFPDIVNQPFILKYNIVQSAIDELATAGRDCSADFLDEARKIMDIFEPYLKE